MLHTEHNRLRILSRCEGLLKSYDSCCDLRAWSHDIYYRDQYLREWIKYDVPKSLIPASTLLHFMKTMTCKNRGRATTPSCHPQCKSKVILESICVSCNAMKECFEQDANCEKYFQQEELETSHWPCDRCLEALKNIKMLWKVFVEKMYGLYICKEKGCQARQTESVRNVAKSWQQEVVQQAFLLKKLNSNPCQRCSETNLTAKINNNKYKILRIGENTTKVEVCSKPCSTSSLRSCRSRQKTCDPNSCKYRRHTTQTRPCCKANKGILVCDNDNRFYEAQNACPRYNKCVSVKVKTTDNCCDPCETSSCRLKAELKDLKKQYCEKVSELEKLNCENETLKCKLQCFAKNISNKSSCGAQIGSKMSAIIQPSEWLTSKNSNCCMENPEAIASEVAITLRSCSEEGSKHVSLLQVLHKTRDPTHELIQSNQCGEEQNPIDLLTQVHNQFGEIIKREICIALEKKKHPDKYDVDLTFHTVKPAISKPSCCTLHSGSYMSFDQP